jgi:phosphoglycolate phosphatase
MATIEIPGHRFKDIELVIFDKDGTLLELHHYWSGMSEMRADFISRKFKLSDVQRVDLLHSMGVDIKSRRLLPEGPVGIKKREIVMQSASDYLASIGCTNADELCRYAFENVDNALTDTLKVLIKPIPGAQELLDRLYKCRCKAAIATTDRYHRSKFGMEYVGFDKKINMIVGADNVKKTKPDPECIFIITDKLKVDPSQVIMIGDTSVDIETGNAACLAGCIAVLTGQTPKNILYSSTPHVVDSVADIGARI